MEKPSLKRKGTAWRMRHVDLLRNAMRASPEQVRCGVQGCMVAEAPKGLTVRREARFPSPVRNVT